MRAINALARRPGHRPADRLHDLHRRQRRQHPVQRGPLAHRPARRPRHGAPRLRQHGASGRASAARTTRTPSYWHPAGTPAGGTADNYRAKYGYPTVPTLHDACRTPFTVHRPEDRLVQRVRQPRRPGAGHRPVARACSAPSRPGRSRSPACRPASTSPACSPGCGAGDPTVVQTAAHARPGQARHARREPAAADAPADRRRALQHHRHPGRARLHAAATSTTAPRTTASTAARCTASRSTPSRPRATTRARWTRRSSPGCRRSCRPTARATSTRPGRG